MGINKKTLPKGLVAFIGADREMDRFFRDLSVKTAEGTSLTLDELAAAVFTLGINKNQELEYRLNQLEKKVQFLSDLEDIKNELEEIRRMTAWHSHRKLS